MKSTQSEQLESETESVSFEEETVQEENVEIVPATPPTGGTGTPQAQKGSSVPSSWAVGSVWLRYAVGLTGKGSCESSTET